MKNTRIYLVALLFLIASCSKKPTTITPSSGSTLPTTLSSYFPGIDTATLWLTDGHNIAGYAKITSTTNRLVFHGYPPYVPLDSFILHFTSTAPDTLPEPIAGGKKAALLFNLHRAGIDTLISYGNPIGIDGIGTAHPFYYMEIDGGNLPSYSIGRGFYSDTL